MRNASEKLEFVSEQRLNAFFARYCVSSPKEILEEKGWVTGVFAGDIASCMGDIIKTASHADKGKHIMSFIAMCGVWSRIEKEDKCDWLLRLAAASSAREILDLLASTVTGIADHDAELLGFNEIFKYMVTLSKSQFVAFREKARETSMLALREIFSEICPQAMN